MVAAILAAVASIIVAILSITLPRFSAKHQRELAILEMDLAEKFAPESKAHERLTRIAGIRVHDWSHRQENSLVFSAVVASRLFALGLACVAATLALGLLIQPPGFMDAVRSTGDTLGGVLAILSIVLLAGGMIASVLTSVRHVRELRARRSQSDWSTPGATD